MNDPDARTLTAVGTGLAEARNSLSDVRMTTPPQEIIVRGRKRRRRNRIAIAAAVTLGLTAGAALWGPLTATSPAAPVIASPQGQVQIRTAAWTVVRDPDGIVTLTIRQFRNADSLRRALAQAGVPAVVLYRHVCPYPSAGQPQVPAVFPGTGHSSADVWLRIRPSAMPSGTKLLIGFQADSDLVLRRHPLPGQGRLTFIELVWDSSANLATPVNGHCPR